MPPGVDCTFSSLLLLTDFIARIKNTKTERNDRYVVRFVAQLGSEIKRYSASFLSQKPQTPQVGIALHAIADCRLRSNFTIKANPQTLQSDDSNSSNK